MTYLMQSGYNFQQPNYLSGLGNPQDAFQDAMSQINGGGNYFNQGSQYGSYNNGSQYGSFGNNNCFGNNCYGQQQQFGMQPGQMMGNQIMGAMLQHIGRDLRDDGMLNGSVKPGQANNMFDAFQQMQGINPNDPMAQNKMMGQKLMNIGGDLKDDGMLNRSNMQQQNPMMMLMQMMMGLMGGMMNMMSQLMGGGQQQQQQQFPMFFQ